MAQENAPKRPKRGFPIWVAAGVAVLALAGIGFVVSDQDEQQSDSNTSARNGSADNREDSSESGASEDPAAGSASGGKSATEDDESTSGGEEIDEPGSLDAVRVEPAEVEPPVGLDAKNGFGTGVTARISKLESVQGLARGPGEISGPALRITVALANSSAREVSVPTSSMSAI